MYIVVLAWYLSCHLPQKRHLFLFFLIVEIISKSIPFNTVIIAAAIDIHPYGAALIAESWRRYNIVLGRRDEKDSPRQQARGQIHR